MRKFASLFIVCLVLFGAIEVQAFTLQIVADNDFAVFTGNSSGINNVLYQSSGTWNTQIDIRQSLDFPMPAGDTEFYVLGMGGGVEENLNGTVNGIDMVTLAGNGKVMMSGNLNSFLSNYDLGAVTDGSYNARLIDVQSAYPQMTWNNAFNARNCTATVIVKSAPPSGCGFAFSPTNAVLFKFAAADVNVDYGHKFVGTTTTMDVYKNATATDIKSLLHFSDTESAQTITWSQSVAPDQGGTLSFTNATASSGSSDITPVGTITYTPKIGFVGTEYFTVQATDGNYRNTRRITVTVLPHQYTVTSSVGSHGSITPVGPVTVIEDQTTSFTIKPDAGYKVVTPIFSTCGGSYTGSIADSVNGIIFTTSAVIADCSVAAAFTPPIRYAAPANVGSGNCSNWDNACTLQSALTAAVSGDEIWVKRGTHKPTSVTTDRSATFQLKNRVAVYGGFAGTETARAQRDPATNATILSGDLLGNDSGFTNNGENSYHVVTGASEATLDGFTITGGNTSGDSQNYGGGGMYNGNSSPTLTNLTFSGNTGTSGGGMFNDYSNPTLTNVTFIGNAGTNGGGMLNSFSNPTLTNVTFSGNTATDGGGMNNYFSSPMLINITFSGNAASGSGGGMYNISNYDPFNPQANCSPIIRNSIFWGSSGGEVVNVLSATANITESVVSGGCPAATTCSNIIIANPLLGMLGNYGGFTATIPLQSGSSAIDATGSNCPATDQRGVARSATCDIGAFELSTSTVNYDGNGNTGGTAPTDGKSPYVFGSSVTALANSGNLSNTGYTFAGWNSKADGSGTAYTPGATFTISIDTILYAQWRTSRTLTVNVGGTGTGTVSSAPGGIMCDKTGSSTAICSNTFTGDVTLTATRSIYSVFKEWSSCVGISACMVTLNTDKSVTATFNALRIGTDYATLQAVYDATQDSSVIQLLQSSTGETVGTLIPNRDVVVKLSGGYAVGYLTTPDRTAITGPVRISKGKMILERVAVK